MGAAGEGAGKSGEVWVSERDRGSAGVGVYGGAGVRRDMSGDAMRAAQSKEKGGGLDAAECMYQRWGGGESRLAGCAESTVRDVDAT